ncbi:hypothetical protein SNEBB_009327 [Seison nebaliae]|nr:hypothetical protein SNEBB_009327 [Seison nebaliae]
MSLIDVVYETYTRLPPVTRTYITLSALLALLCQMEICTPFQLYYTPSIAWKEPWRLVTSFCYVGSIDIHFLFHIIFTYPYAQYLEEESASSINFLFICMFGGFVLLIAAGLLQIIFLNSAFNVMLMYIWSRRNPDVVLSFMGVFTFTASHLQCVLLIVPILLGQPIVTEILGILTGHLIFYTTDLSYLYDDISFMDRCLNAKNYFIITVNQVFQAIQLRGESRRRNRNTDGEHTTPSTTPPPSHSSKSSGVSKFSRKPKATTSNDSNSKGNMSIKLREITKVQVDKISKSETELKVKPKSEKKIESEIESRGRSRKKQKTRRRNSTTAEIVKYGKAKEKLLETSNKSKKEMDEQVRRVSTNSKESSTAAAIEEAKQVLNRIIQESKKNKMRSSKDKEMSNNMLYTERCRNSLLKPDRLSERSSRSKDSKTSKSKQVKFSECKIPKPPSSTRLVRRSSKLMEKSTYELPTNELPCSNITSKRLSESLIKLLSDIPPHALTCSSNSNSCEQRHSRNCNFSENDCSNRSPSPTLSCLLESIPNTSSPRSLSTASPKNGSPVSTLRLPVWSNCNSANKSIITASVTDTSNIGIPTASSEGNSLSKRMWNTTGCTNGSTDYSSNSDCENDNDVTE